MALQKVDKYVVGEEDSWVNDKLDRKRVAEYLTPIIASVTQPFTISLHSPFGTGKTSFIQSWQADLQKQKYKTVYFNAWETDFSQDAFFAFMEAVQRELKSQETDPSVAKTIVDKIAKATRKGAGFVGEKALPLILRGLATKVAGAETVQGLLALIGQSDASVGELTGTLAEEGLKSQRDAEKSRIDFRTDLSNTVKSLFDESTPAEKRKVIVFVDDLDRCRPSYAIQLLEAIKHLFSVDGLLFILAVDEPQLAQAVTSVYGTGIDSRGSLARFLDWRYSLPKPKLSVICEYLASRYRLSELPWVREGSDFTSINVFVEFLAIYADGYSMSVRELEQVFTLVNLCLRSQGKTSRLLMPVLAGAAILRHAVRDELEAALNDSSSKKKLIQDVNDRLCRVDPRGVIKGEHRFVEQLKCWLMNQDQMNVLAKEAKDLESGLNNEGAHSSLSKKGLSHDTVTNMLNVVHYRSYILTQFNIKEEPIRAPIRALDTAGQMIYE